MKTAMQEFFMVINEFNKELYNTMYNEGILDTALEKEKEQIVGFGNKMQIVQDVSYDGNITFCFNPEEYYNQTYNQNK